MTINCDPDEKRPPRHSSLRGLAYIHVCAHNIREARDCPKRGRRWKRNEWIEWEMPWCVLDREQPAIKFDVHESSIKNDCVYVLYTHTHTHIECRLQVEEENKNKTKKRDEPAKERRRMIETSGTFSFFFFLLHHFFISFKCHAHYNNNNVFTQCSPSRSMTTLVFFQ